MKLPDLTNLGLRCACGEDIEVQTWDDNQWESIVVSLRAHDRRYDQRISRMELCGYRDGPQWVIEKACRKGEYALRKDCPCRAPAVFGEVTDCNYAAIDYEMPDGRVVRKMARVHRQQVSTLPPAPAARPVIHPSFGQTIARKILTT